MSDASGNTQERKTLVEEETEFKGTMTSRCPVVVMGRLEGEVEAPSMHVTTSGAVAGTVVVKDLTSEGELAGEVDADSVQLSGSVKDSTVIRAKALEVRLSNNKGKMEVQFGECELAIGDEPNKAAAIEAAMTSSAKNKVVKAEKAAKADAPAADVPAPAAASDAAASDDAAADKPAEQTAAGESDGDWDLPDGGEGPKSKRADSKSEGSKKGSKSRQRRNSQSPPPA